MYARFLRVASWSLVRVKRARERQPLKGVSDALWGNRGTVADSFHCGGNLTLQTRREADYSLLVIRG